MLWYGASLIKPNTGVCGRFKGILGRDMRSNFGSKVYIIL